MRERVMDPAEEMVRREILTVQQMTNWRDHPNAALNRSINIEQFRALCDLALSAESLSRRVAELEAVIREELETGFDVAPTPTRKRLRESLQRKDGQ